MRKSAGGKGNAKRTTRSKAAEKKKSTSRKSAQRSKKAAPVQVSGKAPRKGEVSAVDTAEVAGKLEKISEVLIFAEPSDYRALADLLTMLEEVVSQTEQLSLEKASSAAAAAGKLIESVILEESPDPQATLDAVGRTMAVLQEIARDGRDPEEVDFPEELGFEGAKDGGSEGGNALLDYKLPAHIDESILAEFLTRQSEVLEEIEALILSFEKEEDANKLDELKRALHTLKGESALLGISDVERLCHATEDILGIVTPARAVDTLLAVKDWLSKAIAFLAGGAKAPEPVGTVLTRLEEITAPVDSAAGSEAQPAEAMAGTDATAGPIYLQGDPSLLADFVSEARDHLEVADVHILTLETEPDDEEALNAVFRAFHTIKGVAGFLALDEIGALAHEAENLLDKARKGELRLMSDAIDVTFDAVDALKRMVGYVSHSLATGEPLQSEGALPALLRRIQSVAAGRIVHEEDRQPEPEPDEPRAKLGHILVDQGLVAMESVEEALERQQEPPEKKKIGEILVDAAVSSRREVSEALDEQRRSTKKGRIGEILVEKGAATEEEIEAALKQQQDDPVHPRLGEILVREGEVPAKAVAQALRSQKGGVTAGKLKETLKVDADRLDRLVDTIGELVIAESMVSQSEELRAIASTELLRHLQQLDKITRELQEMGTSLRMVPVRQTFQKMARLVRDLSKKAGKPIEFFMSGEDTELDKTVVDRIGDPLVHMVRNAVDHGIESDPEERVKAGKPRSGQIQLRAFHKGGSIFIEIEDDGRGLDCESILAKAKERGLVRDGDSMSEKEIYNLIFEPGFSTATKVTDVSGRGVGMDVVRKNIEALRGQVEIRSERGKGSVFTLRLPLTLAIIDGMVVRVGPERYIIPTLSIVRSIKPSKGELTAVLGRGEVLRVQDQLIPLYRLSNLFQIEGAEIDPLKALVVVVEDDGKHAGLMIDELLGQQQIVIKSLGEMMRDSPGISGGAIMPDGRVGLILDVSSLIKMAYEQEPPAKEVGSGNAE